MSPPSRKRTDSSENESASRRGRRSDAEGPTESSDAGGERTEALTGRIESLHRTYGNRTVRRMLSRRRASRQAAENDDESLDGLPSDGGFPLADAVRADFESRFGADLSDVRVHEGTDAAAFNRHLGSSAFAYGSHVFFGSGEYRPKSYDGRNIIAHEVAHTLQQRNASATRRPAVDRPGGAAEREADRAADAVADGDQFEVLGEESERSIQRNGGPILSGAGMPEQPPPSAAERFIDSFTNWIGNLDEDALGRALLRRALDGNPGFVRSVIGALGWGDRDDVAFAFSHAATDSQLETVAATEDGKRLLNRLSDELRGGYTGDDERREADRLVGARERRTRRETETLLQEFRSLYEQKERIARGEGDVSEVERITTRLREVTQELNRLGVNRDEYSLYRAVSEGTDVLAVTGEITTTAAEPLVFGQKVDFTVLLDYVPPGRSVEVAWRWRTGDGDRSYRFPGTSRRGPERSLQLRELFWNLSGSGHVQEMVADGLVVTAQVYLGDEQNPVTTLTRRLSVRDAVPQSLSLAPARETYVQGQRARFEIAEWVPPVSTYSVDWYVDETLIAGDQPVVSHTFSSTGRSTVAAKIHSVSRVFGIRDKTLFRTVRRTVRVDDPTETGRAVLERTPRDRLPSLSTLETSITDSISEMERRVAQGGEQATYWEQRLEGQRRRLDAIRRHVPDIGETEDLPADTAELDAASYAGPVPAVLVVPESGETQPLAIYLTVRPAGSGWAAQLVDATSADVWRFEGSGATPLSAYEAAFEVWRGDHPYPLGGRVVYQFSPPGWSLGGSFETTNDWNEAMAWIDGVLTVAGFVAAGLLLLAPEATFTKYLGATLLAAMAARSTVAIYQNINRGLEPLDRRNVLEGISILGSALGVGGAFARQAGLWAVRPVLYRAGNWTIMAAAATDVGTAVLVTHDALQQLRAVQADPTLDESQRSLRTIQLISALTLQGVLLYVSNRDLFRGGLLASDFLPTNPRATAEAARGGGAGRDVSLEPGSRLDVAVELRRAGEDVSRLRRPTEAEPGARAEEGPAPYTDRELIARFDALQWIRRSNLSPEETRRMLRTLSTDALSGLQDIEARQARQLLDDAASDRVVNELAPALGGATLRDLHAELDAVRVQELLDTFQAQGAARLVTDVGVPRLGRLLQGIGATDLRTLSTDLTNPVLRNLGGELTGAEVQALVTRHSADVVRWAGTDLNGQQARTLLTQLDPAAAAGLRDVSATRAQTLVDGYGHGLLNRVVPTVGGADLAVLADSLGSTTARGIAADKAEGGELSKLVEYAASLRGARSPTGTGELVSPTALGPSSVIVDANYLQYLHFATQKVASGMSVDQLPGVERNVYLDYQRRLAAGDVDLRASNVAIGESGGKVSSAPGRQGLPIDLTVRNSAEYGDVLGQLRANRVGGTGDAAAADRAVVADAFFSVPAGQPATFVTADQGVLKGLARVAGHDPATLGQRVPDAFPNGFEVTVTAGGTTRRLWVVPISTR